MFGRSTRRDAGDMRNLNKLKNKSVAASRHLDFIQASSHKANKTTTLNSDKGRVSYLSILRVELAGSKNLEVSSRRTRGGYHGDYWRLKREAGACIHV